MKDFTVFLGNRPGRLANLGEVLGKAGVNIEGLCGIQFEGKGHIHFVVEDHETAKKALQKAEIEIIAERDVLVLDIESIAGKPGTGAEINRRLAEAGINIDLIYVAENNRIVLGVDNPDKALSVL